MLKFISNGENLIGKTIKYCNIVNGSDGNEHNIIATEEGDIMCFNVGYENGTIETYSEKMFKSAMHREWLVKDLLQHGVINQDILDKWELERKEAREKQEQTIRDYKYKEYLKLKEEFEEK